MKVYKAWKKLQGYKKFYGVDSLQYKKALKEYDGAFRLFALDMMVFCPKLEVNIEMKGA